MLARTPRNAPQMPAGASERFSPIGTYLIILTLVLDIAIVLWVLTAWWSQSATFNGRWPQHEFELYRFQGHVQHVEAA